MTGVAKFETSQAGAQAKVVPPEFVGLGFVSAAPILVSDSAWSRCDRPPGVAGDAAMIAASTHRLNRAWTSASPSPCALMRLGAKKERVALLLAQPEQPAKLREDAVHTPDSDLPEPA